MARFLVVLLFLCFAGFASADGSAASSCPEPKPSGGKIAAKASRLASAHSAQVVAGGDIVLAACGGLPGQGRVAPAPNFNVMLAEGGGRPLEFRTEGDCDTVLVVASAGAWHYDDDGAGDGGARVRIDAAPDGRYDVWVGTYGEGTCRARLLLQAPS